MMVTILLLVFACVNSDICATSTFDVEVNVQTSWPKISILAEAIEFISDVNRNDVLLALRQISRDLQVPESATTSTSSQYFQLSQEMLQPEHELRILEGLNMALFKSPFTGPLLSLSVFNRYFSARVEFSRSLERRLRGIAAPCSSDTYAVVCTPLEKTYKVQFICNEADLNSWVFKPNGSKPDSVSSDYHPCLLLSTDHFLQQFPEHIKLNLEEAFPFVLYDTNIPHVILFSSLSTLFAPFLEKLLSVITSNAFDNIPVVYRHSDPSGCRLLPPQSDASSATASSSVDTSDGISLNELCRKHSDSLGSFGVDLTVKNQDYKATNEELNKYSEPVTRCHERAPDQIEDIGDVFKSCTPTFQNEDEIPDVMLNKEEVKLLGLQATAEIARHRSANDRNDYKFAYRQLQVWSDLSSNFPSFAKKLSKSDVPSAIPAAVDELRLSNAWQRFSALSFNGYSLGGGGPRKEDLFGVLKLIGPQLVAIEAYMREGIALESALQLIRPIRFVEANKEKTEGSRFDLDKLPARLDWIGMTLAHDNKDRWNVLVPIWNVLNHPITRSWARTPGNMLQTLTQEIMRVRLPLFHILVVFDPLNVDQLGSALGYLLELPMKLFFLPVASHCKFDFRTAVF